MMNRRLYIKKLLLSTLICLVGVSFVVGLVHAKGGSTVIDQRHFQFYNNDGTTVDDATAKATVDATSTQITVGEVFHIRLSAVQTVTKPDADLTRTIKLQYSSDAAGDCTGVTGSWTDVPTKPNWVAQAFRQATTTNFTDGDTTTARLDILNHIGGDGVQNEGSPDPVSYTNGANANTEQAEWEWALEEKAGTTGQSYWFRFVNFADGTTNVTWTMCAVLEVPAGATVSCSTDVTSTAFATLDSGLVSTSTPNASTTMSCSGTSDGCTLYIKDAGSGSNPGLWNSTSSELIESPNLADDATTTLSIGTEGFGIRAATTTAGSGTLTLNTRYSIYKELSGSVNDVGGLEITNQTLASSTADVTDREVIVTHKAAIANTTSIGTYDDTITYSCTLN